ncbi:alpha-tocopherol transfer protein-like isoform X1 [Plodia interpunctella]|uniref:alpha-tocopherol transfer protein-like isoform X1 n=1 Tax=Plodia interpunctella TaxID=58824 RepID=UPI002367F927|nr:alpha-tocopherol transfer protein-like isoform X1 [Plodia interpunctella]
METLPTNPVLLFRPDTLQSVRKLNNFEDPKKLDEAIDILQEWARKQPHFVVKEFDRDFLERIIIFNKGLLERSKTRLDKYCTLHNLMPEFFRPIHIINDLSNLEFMKDAIMPQLTPEHYRIYILKNTGQQFTSKVLLDYYIRLVNFWQYAMRYDYYAGVICVYDVSEANLMDLVTSMNMTYMRQMLTVIMEGFGARLKAVYTVSDSKVVSTLHDLVRPLLSKKLADRVHVLNNINLLKEKVPIDIMPVEYGGKEKPLAELHQNWLNVLTSDDQLEYMKKMSEVKTDESLRPADKFNQDYMGMAGTFRTLNVD